MSSFETQSLGYDAEFNFEARPLPRWFNEPNDRADYRAYEPTPMLPSVDSDTRQHQSLVQNSLLPLFRKSVPEGIPPTTEEMIENNYLANEAMRSFLNHSNYITWLGQKPEIDTEIGVLLAQAERGLASPAELLYILKNTTIESTELGKLTHPYRYRMDHLSDMRRTVNQAILDQGGQTIENSPYRAIKFYPYCLPVESPNGYVPDSDYKLHGFVTTYKHDIGRLVATDGREINVAERQTIAIRIDDMTSFDKDLAESLSQIAIGQDDKWLERIVDETGFRNYIEASIQANQLPDYMIPLSTMAYAHEMREDD